LRLLHMAPSKGFDNPRNRALVWLDATVLRVEQGSPPFRSVLAFVDAVSCRRSGAAAELEGGAATGAESKDPQEDQQVGAAAPTAALQGQLVFLHFADAPCSREREPAVVGRSLRIYDAVCTPSGIACTQVYEPVQDAAPVPLSAVQTARSWPPFVAF